MTAQPGSAPPPQAVTTETKPGVRTTEFWAMIFGNVLGLVQLFANPVSIGDGKTGLAMSILTGAYIASRGLAKSSVPYTGAP